MTFLRFWVGSVEAVRDERLRVLVLGLARGRERFNEAEEGGGISEDDEVDPGIREGTGPPPGTRSVEAADAGVRCGTAGDRATGLGRGGGGIKLDGSVAFEDGFWLD